MNRIIIATLVVALAAMMAGCGEKQKEAPTSAKDLPDASKMFDKKEVPNKTAKTSTAN